MERSAMGETSQKSVPVKQKCIATPLTFTDKLAKDLEVHEFW